MALKKLNQYTVIKTEIVYHPTNFRKLKLVKQQTWKAMIYESYNWTITYQTKK